MEAMGPEDEAEAAGSSPELQRVCSIISHRKREAADVAMPAQGAASQGESLAPGGSGSGEAAAAGAAATWACPDLRWWLDVDITESLSRRVAVVAAVPEPLHLQYRVAKRCLLQRAAAAGTPGEEMAAWKALLVLDRLLLWKGFSRGGGGRNGRRHNANVRTVSERLALFWAGQWDELWQQHLAAAPVGGRRAKKGEGKLTAARIQGMVEDGAWPRLLAAVRGGCSLADGPEVVDDLATLLPDRHSASVAGPTTEIGLDVDDFAEAVKKELRGASPHAAGGRDGSRARHWQVGSGDEEFEGTLASTLPRWLSSPLKRATPSWRAPTPRAARVRPLSRLV